MLLLKPTGRFPVGVQDVKYTTVHSADKIAADNVRAWAGVRARALACLVTHAPLLPAPPHHPQHVVGRLFYPCKPRSLLQRLMGPPLTWIRSYDYAAGALPV